MPPLAEVLPVATLRRGDTRTPLVVDAQVGEVAGEPGGAASTAQP